MNHSNFTRIKKGCIKWRPDIALTSLYFMYISKVCVACHRLFAIVNKIPQSKIMPLRKAAPPSWSYCLRQFCWCCCRLFRHSLIFSKLLFLAIFLYDQYNIQFRAKQYSAKRVNCTPRECGKLPLVKCLHIHIRSTESVFNLSNPKRVTHVHSNIISIENSILFVEK